MVPGTDLIVGLRAAQRTTGAGAIAVVTCVGSLTSVVLRHANRSVPTVYTGHFEITSLVGTVDRDGEHVHLTIADGEGRACGGHLMPGSQVYTTAEIVLLILDDLTFAREPCRLSGYDELVVEKNLNRGVHDLNAGTFATRNLVLAAIGIALNIAVGQAAAFVKLPIFLDSIGTMLAAVLCGPVIGGLTGLLTNLIWGLLAAPTAAFFAPVAMVIGIAAGLLARAGMFRTWWQTAISGVLITVALAFVAVPIRIYLFGGVTGSGADFAVAYFLKLGQSLFGAVLTTVLGWNIVDKVFSALLVWGIVRGLPARSVGEWRFLAYSRG